MLLQLRNFLEVAWGPHNGHSKQCVLDQILASQRQHFCQEVLWASPTDSLDISTDLVISDQAHERI